MNCIDLGSVRRSWTVMLTVVLVLLLGATGCRQLSRRLHRKVPVVRPVGAEERARRAVLDAVFVHPNAERRDRAVRAWLRSVSPEPLSLGCGEAKSWGAFEVVARAAECQGTQAGLLSAVLTADLEALRAHLLASNRETNRDYRSIYEIRRGAFLCLLGEEQRGRGVLAGIGDAFWADAAQNARIACRDPKARKPSPGPDVTGLYLRLRAGVEVEPSVHLWPQEGDMLLAAGRTSAARVAWLFDLFQAPDDDPTTAEDDSFSYSRTKGQPRANQLGELGAYGVRGIYARLVGVYDLDPALAVEAAERVERVTSELVKLRVGAVLAGKHELLHPIDRRPVEDLALGYRLQAAEGFVARGEIRRALEQADRVDAATPSGHPSWTGTVRALAGDGEGADAAFSSRIDAAALSPDERAEAALLRATLLASAGQLEEAFQETRRAIRIKSSHDAVVLCAAIALLAREDHAVCVPRMNGELRARFGGKSDYVGLAIPEWLAFIALPESQRAVWRSRLDRGPIDGWVSGLAQSYLQGRAVEGEIEVWLDALMPSNIAPADYAFYARLRAEVAGWRGDSVAAAQWNARLSLIQGMVKSQPDMALADAAFRL
jgi:hypothetical protein